MTRFVLLDQITGRTIYITLSDVKTMQEVLHRASHNHRPSQMQDAMPRMRGDCTGYEGVDCQARVPHVSRMELVGKFKQDNAADELLPRTVHNMRRGERY